jgi:hypothetical protein
VVAFGHDFDHLDLAIHMFNHDPLACQTPVECLFVLCQGTVFALFVRYFAVGMITRNALITTVRLDLDIRGDNTAWMIFVNLKVVNTTFSLFNT